MLILPLIASLLIAVAIFLLTRVLLKFWHTRPPLSPKLFWRLVDRVPVPSVIALAGRKRNLTKSVEIAGLPPEWTVHRFLVLKQLSALIIILFFARLLESGTPFTRVTLPGLILIIVAWVWPELYLTRHALFRKRQALKTLASVIDLLRLQIESGTNLESALRALAHERTDLWGIELSRTVFLLDRGVPFDQALDSLAQRFGMDDVNRLVLAIKQAKLLGASLSDTLTIQGDMLRTRRRQQAEEKARLASVKIALPLVFFIFPALLIIYLAPAVLHILQSF